MTRPFALPDTVEQPPVVEIKLCPGLFVKQMLLLYAGTVVPQHSHAYDHLSMLAVGAVHVWRDDVYLGRFDAPCGILIEKRAKHAFMSIKDGTIIYCIHRVGPDGEPEVIEEHHFEEAV